MFVSAVLVYLLYGSAGVRVITAAGGRSYKENSRFKRKVATGCEEEEQDVDPLIKLAKAAATAADDLAVPTSGSNEDDIPPRKVPYVGGRTSSVRKIIQTKGGGQVHANQGLSTDLLGLDVNEDNFVERMVAMIAERRTKFAAQRFQDKRNKPMTYAQQRDYMRTFVKNQSSTIYTIGWTMKHVRSFSDDQLKDEFDKIRHAAANLQSQHLRRSLKRQGSNLEQPDSKKSKSTEPQKTSVPAVSRPSSAGVTHDVYQSPFVDTSPATPPHSPTSKQPSVTPKPPSGFSATPTVTRTSGPRTRNQSSAAGIKTYSTKRKSLGSRNMSSSEVDLIAADSQPPSMEVPSQKASQEDVEVPSTTTSTAQQTASSTKKVGTRRKQFGQKGVHPSRSTNPIEDEDLDAEHKMCIKYASDTDSDSDDNTHVNLHGVVDWELLPTGLGWVNVIYRKDNSRKCFSRLREILHLVLIDSPEVNDGSDGWKDQNTWLIQSWKLYSSTGIHVLEMVSGHVLHMFVDKRYPLSVNLIERMLEHQLEICRDTVGNELTTAVQLIVFLKKQISDLRRPKLVVNVVFCLLKHLDFWYTLLRKDHLVFKTVDEHFAFQAHLCDADFLVAASKYMTVAFEDGFQDVAVQSSGAFKERSI
ncbi:hypothetical protein Tco_0637412 [Tanacetum coccineum]